MNLNKAFVLGNVTRNPEVRSLPSGLQVASFGIATNRFYTDKEGQKKQDAEFHNITCFGKLADISAKYLTKGSLVLIEGRIKTSNWQNTSGVKQYRTEIIAESMQLGPRPSGQTGSGQYSRPPTSNQQPKVDTQDIPIIEENYTAPDINQDMGHSSLQNNTDEIDIKDIPF